MRSLAVLVILLASIVAHAESDAERFYNEGKRAFEAQRFEDALTAWEKSYAISKLPGLLFNIAQAQRLRGKLGDCTKASASYMQFVATTSPSEQRTLAQEFIRDLAPCVNAEARAAAATPAPASPTTATTMPIAPTSTTTTATTAPVATVAEPADRKGLRYSGLIVGGAGVVAVLTGVRFGMRAKQLANEVSAECRDTCDWTFIKSKDADGRRAESTQYILYGVGAAAVATGAVLWWLSKTPARTTIAVTPTPGGAAVLWRGAW